MSEMFNTAFADLMRWEGVYSDDPDDAGGATKYGISLRFYKGNIDRYATKEDIQNLTLEDARGIYRIHFWDAAQIPRLRDEAVASKLFDGVVLHGPSRGVKLFQAALGVVEDGIMGPVTAGEANATYDLKRLLAKMRYERLEHINMLLRYKSSWEKFRKGWILRALA